MVPAWLISFWMRRRLMIPRPLMRVMGMGMRERRTRRRGRDDGRNTRGSRWRYGEAELKIQSYRRIMAASTRSVDGRYRIYKH